ncbi:MAG: hypothetical protein DCF20_20830 [Pseudanabaena sp.]|nr:MAG: hypothetical protein DCF20_20830 [Pseudanabaena sp.]
MNIIEYIVYSPLGMRSDAHLNLSVTLTFWRLKKIRTTVKVPSSSPLPTTFRLASFSGSSKGLTLVATL